MRILCGLLVSLAALRCSAAVFHLVEFHEAAGDAQGKYVPRITEHGAAELAKLPPDADVRVVSIVGKARTGKSFLMNKLVGLACQRGFQVSHEDHACTRGLWAHAVVQSAEGERPKVTLYIDTEGLDSADVGDRFQDHDPVLLSLSLTISSLVIHNTQHHVSGYVVDIASAMRESFGKRERVQFPALLWLINNDGLVHSGSIRSHVAELLSDEGHSADSSEEMAEVRKVLAQLRWDAFNTSTPHHETAMLCNVDDDALSAKYLREIDQLRGVIHKMAEPLNIEGNELRVRACRTRFRESYPYTKRIFLSNVKFCHGHFSQHAVGPMRKQVLEYLQTYLGEQEEEFEARINTTILNHVGILVFAVGAVAYLIQYHMLRAGSTSILSSLYIYSLSAVQYCAGLIFLAIMSARIFQLPFDSIPLWSEVVRAHEFVFEMRALVGLAAGIGFCALLVQAWRGEYRSAPAAKELRVKETRTSQSKQDDARALPQPEASSKEHQSLRQRRQNGSEGAARGLEEVAHKNGTEPTSEPSSPLSIADDTESPHAKEDAEKDDTGTRVESSSSSADGEGSSDGAARVANDHRQSGNAENTAQVALSTAESQSPLSQEQLSSISEQVSSALETFGSDLGPEERTILAINLFRSFKGQASSSSLGESMVSHPDTGSSAALPVTARATPKKVPSQSTASTDSMSQHDVLEAFSPIHPTHTGGSGEGREYARVASAPPGGKSARSAGDGGSAPRESRTGDKSDATSRAAAQPASQHRTAARQFSRGQHDSSSQVSGEEIHRRLEALEKKNVRVP